MQAISLGCQVEHARELIYSDGVDLDNLEAATPVGIVGVGAIVAMGDLVVTEHAETWTWDDDHTVRLPFTSVMEVRDGKVARWWDYLDLSTLMNAAPAWWVEHIAAGYQ